MPDKLHKTKGIVLRTVKYGETSVIVTFFTELFGVQSYLVNGVRTSSKKGSGKANLFQPTAILDLIVYYNELKNLQRIKEFKWSILYKNILSDVTKNAIALFMIELLSKCLKQPESNPDLFAFAEDSLLHLDRSETVEAANFPLFFALNLSGFFGLRINDNYSDRYSILDLQEGSFVNEKPDHPFFIDQKEAKVTADLLRVMQTAELNQIQLNQDFRRSLLFAYEKYYALHMQDFGTMRSLPVLSAILA
ncbi:MAG: DNA repair protein RecO [Chitinophagaceae bacterium]